MDDLNALRHVDIPDLAKKQIRKQVSVPLAALPRVTSYLDPSGNMSELSAVYDIAWLERANAQGRIQPWLILSIQAIFPMSCQRCLEPMPVGILASNTFRFVSDEKQAEKEDAVSDEDVLMVSKDFDLLALIEDELLLAIPYAPRHENCSKLMKEQFDSDQFNQAENEKKHPFDALKQLKKSSDA